MLSFEEAADYLDTIVNELPEVLLRELNGGISLVPQAQASDNGSGLYTLGKYFKNKQMGRYILLYYGSFKIALATANRNAWCKKLREVVLHELTHHNESLAGIDSLAEKDRAQIEHYKNTGKFLPISKF